MAVFNLTVTTTPDQDTALADLATAQNTTAQQILTNQLGWLVGNMVTQEVAVDLQKLQTDSLATLETLAGQVPNS